KHVDAGVRVAGMTGQVDIEIDGVRRPLKMDDVIPVDAHIITEEDSKMIFLYDVMSTFVLGPESEIVVSSPPEKESKLKLVAGNIWANVKKMVKDGTMEIEMNQAVAGIKGTTFVCEEKNGKSILKVFEGEVDFKSKATGQSIKVKGGEKTEASTKELSKNESFDVSQEIESWLNLRNAEKINWEEGENKESPIVTKKQGLKKTESKTFNQYFLIGALSVILIIGMFIGAKFNKKLKVNKFLL
ncbi:MAG: FecR family protein, partial [Patescibacteria group bacterium]|nr:FecR family protein [Patescibacteria group bacterium]